jgi:hypothetical protein
MSNLLSYPPHPGRLDVPEHIAKMEGAIELLSVWYASNKVHVMSRAGTRLDDDPAVWGKVLAAIARNVVSRQLHLKGSLASRYIEDIKKSLDAEWSEVASEPSG